MKRIREIKYLDYTQPVTHYFNDNGICITKHRKYKHEGMGWAGISNKKVKISYSTEKSIFL